MHELTPDEDAARTHAHAGQPTDASSAQPEPLTPGHRGPSGETYEEVVFEATRALLDERVGEASEVTAWVTSTEITERTGLDRDVVLEALEGLAADRLHVTPVPGLDDVEVLGLRHDVLPDET